MSESIIADFVAQFDSSVATRAEPAKGRVLLSEKRLVLAVDSSDRLTIPLHSVIDVAVGHVPDEIQGFFESTVTLAFELKGQRHKAVVEAEDSTIQKFATVLFKAILNGTRMSIKHPARVGGRVTDESFAPCRLFLRPQSVRFKTNDNTVEIELATVTKFSRTNRDINGSSQPVLELQHMPSGEAMVTMAAMNTPREMTILGRYLRLEYTELMNELKDVEITADEKEILTAIYSGGGQEGVSLAGIVEIDPSNVTMVLNRLEEKELVVDTASGTRLTPKGQIVVNRHLEEVNV
ncbi:CheF family chemotaxis protein [Halovenus sp. HT40]|uniref:CheF family chemotaxis protein n=1 Tax=Halovenus sp. HT40 TaxID=3126691 RepID=UPI00300EC23D